MARQVVYSCPYCKLPVWFGQKGELVRHIFREHIKIVVDDAAEGCRQIVDYKRGKWMWR